MSLKVTDDGLELALEILADEWNAAMLKLHLYKSNTTPTTATVLGDLTECDFAGYAAVNVTGWTAPSVAAHVATMTAAPKTFTRSSTGASQNIYGYYVTDSGSTVLYWAERDGNAPIVVTNLGDSYTVTPAMTEQDLST